MVFDVASGDPLTSQLNVSGLTLLLPYIVSTRRNWSASKLRVFALANKKDQLEFEQRKYVLGFYCFCFNVGKELSLLSLVSDYCFVVSTCKITPGFTSWQGQILFIFTLSTLTVGCQYSWCECKAAGAWNWPPPPSAEDKNTWGSYAFSPSHVFMAWCLIKYMDVYHFMLNLNWFKRGGRLKWQSSMIQSL